MCRWSLVYNISLIAASRRCKRLEESHLAQDALRRVQRGMTTVSRIIPNMGQSIDLLGTGLVSYHFQLCSWFGHSILVLSVLYNNNGVNMFTMYMTPSFVRAGLWLVCQTDARRMGSSLLQSFHCVYERADSGLNRVLILTGGNKMCLSFLASVLPQRE